MQPHGKTKFNWVSISILSGPTFFYVEPVEAMPAAVLEIVFYFRSEANGAISTFEFRAAEAADCSFLARSSLP